MLSRICFPDSRFAERIKIERGKNVCIRTSRFLSKSLEGGKKRVGGKKYYVVRLYATRDIESNTFAFERVTNSIEKVKRTKHSRAKQI